MIAINTAPNFLNVGDGITGIQFGGQGVYSYATKLANLPNGFFLSALATNSTTNPPIGVALFDSNGNLVSSFGSTGIVTLPTTAYAAFPTVAVDPVRGVFILAGHQSITQYRFDGTLDTSFGTGGTVIQNFSGNTWNHILDVAYDSSGKLLVSNNNGTIARFNQNGTADNSFDFDGVLAASFNTTALQADGKILVANWSGAITRYNSNGTVDETFTSNTVAASRISSILSGGYFNPSGLMQQADGKIIISGTVSSTSSTGSYISQIAVARFNADGSLDTTFDGTGIKSIPFSSSQYAQATTLDIQSDGKILIAGMTNGATVIRLNNDGSFDGTFGSNGVSVINWNVGINRAWDIAVQADGKILISGDGNTGSQLVRLTTNGALDTSFSATPIASASELNDVTYRALSTAVPIAPAGLIISDAGLTAQGNYGGSTLTLRRDGNANGEDVFSAFGNRLSTLNQSSSLLIDGNHIGTVQKNAGGELILAFNSAANQSQVSTVLNLIAYSNTNPAVQGDIRINWIFSDGDSSGPLSTSAYTTISAFTNVSTSPIYVDLSLQSWNSSYNEVSVGGGPNAFYYDSINNNWSSQYYRWADPLNPNSSTSRVTVSPDGNTALLPPANQLQIVGAPLFHGNWREVSAGVWVQDPVVYSPNADLGLLRIHAQGNYPSVQLNFAPWTDSSSAPTYFSLSNAGVTQTQNWISLPPVWAYDSLTQTHTQITGLKAKVVPDMNGTNSFDLLIGRFDAAGNLLNNMTGMQATQILQNINLIDTNTASREAAYSFTIQVSNNAQINNLAQATWYGSSGPGKADDTTVYYDTQAPTASNLHIAQDSLFLAMNGTGSTSTGNTANSQWQGVDDSKLLDNFTVTVAGNQVQVLNIQSHWNGYEVNLAQPINAGQTVTLTYTPPAGTIGINQLDGVVQDEIGNDALSFVITRVAPTNVTGQVINASNVGYSNDDNLDRIHYFKGTGPEVNNAESIKLVSFVGTRAVFEFTMPQLLVGNPGLDGVTISGATHIRAVFQAEVEFRAGTTPYATGYISSIGQTINASSLPNGINSYLDTLDNKLSAVYRFENWAVGNNGDRQFISNHIFNGSSAFSKADNIGDAAALIGNDTFITGSGSDTVYSFGGDDTFITGGGNDTLYGGFGNDTVSFAGVNPGASLQVTLANLLDTNASGSATGSGVNARLVSIENVVGTNFNDVIHGNQANNILSGGSGGLDSLFGAEGNDTLIASAVGNNTLDGGAGRDIAILSGDAQQWSLQSSSGSQVVMRNSSTSQDITISSNVENIGFSNATESPIIYDVASIIQTGRLPTVTSPISPTQITFTGTSGDDYLLGNNLGNTMLGLGGNDTLRGSAGNDTLNGGSGNNLLIGDANNDLYLVDYVTGSTAFTGNFGLDNPNRFSNAIIDNSGVDTLLVTVNEPSNFISTPNAYLNIRRGGEGGADFYIGIREGSQHPAGQDDWFGKVTIAGQYDWNGFSFSGNNTIETLQLSGNIFNGSVNIALAAGSNLTTLFGTSGADYLAAFGSRSTVFGGDGNDYLAASRLDTAAELNTYNARNDLTGNNVLTLDNVVQRANAGTLFGDTLFGGAGIDNLNGYYGNDYLDGGLGADELLGWEGNDTYVIDNALDIVFERHDNGVDTGGQDTIITSLNSLDLRNSRYANVENAILSTSSGSSNSLFGSFANNTLSGGAGNDSIDGVGGMDTIYGGAGNDVITIHNLNGFIDGGAGVDTAQLLSAWNSYSFSLSSNIVINIENVIYAGSNSIYLSGNQLDNTISSGTGNDTLDGGLGNDTLIGGAGNDTYILTLGTGGSDRFIDTSGTSTIIVDRSALTGNRFIFSERGTGADTNLYTRTYADSFGKTLLDTQIFQGNFGNAGTQLIVSNNTYGLNGTSNLLPSYSTYTMVAGNSVNAAPTLSNGSPNPLFIQNSLLTGGTADDIMFGGGGNDWIEGGSGSDTLHASGGYDRMNGGLGQDVAGYRALDNLSSGVQGIMVKAVDQNNSASLNHYYVFKNENYSTFTESRVLNLLGDAKVDYLQSIEIIEGTAQSDLFIGGSSSDRFAGRGGLDTFYGGTGNEFGTDWVDYNNPLFTIGITAKLGNAVSNSNLVLGGYNLGLQNNLISGVVKTQMGPDTLYGIEGIIGTSHADTLIGSTSGNFLRGGLGNDTLIGVSNGLPGQLVERAIDWADYIGTGASVVVRLSANSDASSVLNTNVFGDTNESDSVYGIATNISGAAYGTATGGAGNDILIGMQGVRGGSAADTLIGGAGNDWLSGGLGNDILIGGDGFDTVSYKWASNGVNVNLGVGTYTSSVANFGSGINFNGQIWGTSSGADGIDTLVGIERVVGSRFNDVLTGNTGDNAFRGLDGNDTIDGGSGNDWIVYAEAMTFNNHLTLSTQGITVDLSGPKDASGYITVTVADGNELLMNAGVDKLRGIENITGTIYNDTLVGDAGNNILQGNGGNDELRGGGGSDTADFRLHDASVTVTLTDSGINSDSVQNGTAISSGGNNMLFSIENIRGSEYADTITGNTGANIIDGGAGNDILNGGGGIDTLSYRSALSGANSSGVVVNLGNGIEMQTTAGSAGVDRIQGFENLIGSSFNDTLTAFTGGSSIDAGAGDDTLYGSHGDDVLRGGSGNDLISGGAGVDRALFSGLYTNYSYEINRADSSGAFAGVTITGSDGRDIVQSTVEYIAFDNSSGVVMDVQQSIRYGTAIFVSDGIERDGSSSLTITGSASNDILTGTSVANQTLIGLAGNDVLDGGGGTAIGSAGGDTLIGGLGDDTYVVYSYADKVIEANLQGLDTVQARVSYILPVNVENLAMTYFNPGLTYLGLGNNLNNAMTGGAGADKLYGRVGNDVLSGLSGNDYLSGGEGNDTLFGGDGADALYGNAGTDILSGGSGNDILDAGTGINETLAGGTGDDIYIVNNSVFNQNSIIIENAIEGNDTVITSNASFILANHVETLAFVGINGGNGEGNDSNNTIIGNTGSNTLNGGRGNDTLFGDTANTSLFDGIAGGTSDYLIGGNGDDVLWGQSGDDTLDGGTGNDRMYGGTGNDTYYVDAAGDEVFDAENLASFSSGGLINTGGVDWILATTTIDMSNTNRFQHVEHVRLLDTAPAFVMSGNDYYSTQYIGALGTSVSNILIGNGFDNWLNGMDGDDTINGGAGDDVITGGRGNDLLDGGLGMDILLYGTSSIQDAIEKNDGRYGYNLITTLNSNNSDGIRLNLDSVDFRFDANNIIRANSVTGSNSVDSGVDRVLNFVGALGTNFNDMMVGNAANNWLAGGRGNDTLVGGGGFDVLDFGANSAYGLTVDLGAMRLANGTIVNLNWANYQTQTNALVINLATLSSASNSHYTGAIHNSSTFTSNGGNGLGTLTAWGFEAIGLSENADTLYGTTGNDTAYGLSGNDLMFGGDGNDVLFGNAQTNGILAGTASNDRDTVYGGYGNDNLYAGSGNSSLLGEAGNDSLIGAYGADTLFGGDDNDYLDGAQNDDVLYGGAGNDRIFGGEGQDILIGGGGVDQLSGGLGDDEYLFTGTEAITEFVNQGIDKVLVMSAGYTLGANIEYAALANMPGATPNLISLPSSLTGNELNNLLMGNTGDNTLSGGAGRDTLVGFGGDDTMIGGAGNDLFALTLDPSHSIDPSELNGFGGTITDFNRVGENDQFLLNFIAGGSGNQGFHYQLNVGYGASFINGSTTSNSQVPEAMITYDPSSGLLQIAFQHYQEGTGSEPGFWTYAGNNGNTNLSYLVYGANDLTPAANINAASFLVDSAMDLTHPMQSSSSYWGQQQA
jgi:uncharacterized delta-60 repeat protein